MTKLEQRIEELFEKSINDLGYELYDVEYAKEGKDYYLRVFIDSEKGIDLEDCEKVSNSINDLLDEADYIKEQYFLEVSSPGIERILRKDKQFKDNIGNTVELKLFKKIENEKVLIGILEDVNNEYLMLNINNTTLEIERKDIALVKTVYNW